MIGQPIGGRKIGWPGLSVDRGACLWCKGTITDPRTGQMNRRANWHPECVEVFKDLNWPAHQQAMVDARDRGVCCACGVCTIRVRRGHETKVYDDFGVLPACEVFFDWSREIDHRWPLWAVDPRWPFEVRRGFHEPQNLQTLCRACHAAKSKRESALRAMAKKTGWLKGRAWRDEPAISQPQGPEP